MLILRIILTSCTTTKCQRKMQITQQLNLNDIKPKKIDKAKANTHDEL